MKADSRPQYYRIRRMVQMVREGAETGYLPNSSDFMKEFEVSRRTVARHLAFLRDEERAPLEYDDGRHGFRLSDEPYTLPPVRISRKEAFSFALVRKLLVHYEGTPLHLDMRSVLDKIAESLEGDITIEPDWLSEYVGALPEDSVRIDPDIWTQLAGFMERREAIQAEYQAFTGRVSRYEFQPFHLLAYRGNWYVLAHNVRKDRLLFEPKLAVYITERQWHPTQAFRRGRDGRVEMRLETTGRKELVRWVLSWMPDVKVVAPKSLRERIVEKLRDALRAQEEDKRAEQHAAHLHLPRDRAR
ncbi:MAG: WYL domain-containing protein [Kiritimatiellae bacterium]|nr:WYL domain-containing protein [Kiritimatiellia bacterium]